MSNENQKSLTEAEKLNKAGKEEESTVKELSLDEIENAAGGRIVKF